MIWLVILLLLLATVAWLFLTPSKPIAVDLVEPRTVEAVLRTLMAQGIDGAELKICLRQQPDQCLIFKKYIQSSGQIGCRVSAFEATWTAPVINTFRAELGARGIPVDRSGLVGQSGVTIDCHHDLGLAQVLLRSFFGDVLHQDVERDCVAFFRDVLVRNVPRLTGTGTTESHD
jgi:hypothetical protein